MESEQKFVMRQSQHAVEIVPVSIIPQSKIAYQLTIEVPRNTYFLPSFIFAYSLANK